MRPDGTEAINQFGKKDDTDVTYTEITRDEWGALYEELKQRMTATGGRTTQHNPRVALAWDTEAQVGDRLDFEDGDSYFVEDITNRDMYQVATVTLDGQN